MKILAAQKDKNTKNKTISTCWKTRREAEGLHDELKEKKKKRNCMVVTIHKHRNGEVYLAGLSEIRSHAQDWSPGSMPIVTCHTQTQ